MSTTSPTGHRLLAQAATCRTGSTHPAEILRKVFLFLDVISITVHLQNAAGSVQIHVNSDNLCSTSVDKAV